jgi:hypothetical protein
MIIDLSWSWSIIFIGEKYSPSLVPIFIFKRDEQFIICSVKQSMRQLASFFKVPLNKQPFPVVLYRMDALTKEIQNPRVVSRPDIVQFKWPIRLETSVVMI